MSFAYLPLYTGDYFRDTRGLSMAGHGCYLLLLTYCWDSKGPLPLDEEHIAGICNARNQEERTTMGRILSTYFVQMEDGWYNTRMQKEIERSENISFARSEAGRKGYQAKAKQLPSKSQASASIPTPIPSLSSYQEVQQTGARRARQDSKNNGSRLPENWRIPEDWIELSLALRPDWSRPGVIRESITFRDYWIGKAGKEGVKANWLATWRNWIRRTEKEPER